MHTPCLTDNVPFSSLEARPGPLTATRVSRCQAAREILGTAPIRRCPRPWAPTTRGSPSLA